MQVVADLFGNKQLAGLELAPDILSPVEEATLIDCIDRTGLSPFKFQGWLGKRLTTSYGSGYDFDTGKLAVAQPIPDWLGGLRQKAARFAGLEPADLSQVLLIRYDPGAAIGWQRDRPFYEHVIGVSLGAATTMRFRRRLPRGFERVGVSLARRSIYHLSDDARHGWEHSIAEMTDTRWSVTFRTLSTSGLGALKRASIEGAARP